MKEEIISKPTHEAGLEKLKKVNLTIVEPMVGHTWEISYEGSSNVQCVAYNRAIEEVCLEHKLGPFFQVGPDHEPGYHAWEMLGGETDGERLKDLFSDIHKKAQEIYERRKKLGFV